MYKNTKYGLKHRQSLIAKILLVLPFSLALFLISGYGVALAATLSVSPTSNSVVNGQTFNASILLNTAGVAVDGVDVISIRFNPAILQVVDANAGMSGIQITPGVLLPTTPFNVANNSTGTLQFSQVDTVGSGYNGAGTLATISFTAIATGTSAVTIDFTSGSTSDSNITPATGSVVDLLTGVTNASFTVVSGIDTTPPTVSVTSPSGGSTVSGTATISASASDNIGVTSVELYVDGTLKGTSTTSPYSFLWDTTNGATHACSGAHTHSLTTKAYDAANNQTTSSAVIVNMNNPSYCVTPTPTTTNGTVTATPSAGGITTLTNPNNTYTRITLPTGAVSADTVINVIATDTPPGSLSSSFRVLGKYYNFTAMRGSTPVTSFDQNLTLVFRYPSSEIPAGQSESSVHVQYYNGSAWMSAGGTVDPNNDTVTITINHFTTFAAFSPNPPPTPTPNPTPNPSPSPSSGGGGGGSSGGGGGGTTAVAGCSPGYIFSVTTGQRCPTTTSVPGCLAGYIFSTTTGERCSATSSSTPTSSSGTVSVGSLIKTSTAVNVRQAAGTTGTLLGAQMTGRQGTVIAGPISLNGYTWWQVNYTSGVDGWSAGNYLLSTATSTPTPSPTPTPGSGTLIVFTKPTYTNDRTTVKNLQTTLNKALGLFLKVDGVYGAGTLAAVKAFQAANDLTADGKIGDATRAKLNAVGAITP